MFPNPIQIDLLLIDSRGRLSHFDSKEKTLVTAPSGSPDLVSICSARENILALDSEGGLWWAQCKEEILFEKCAFKDLQETKIAFRAIAQGGLSSSRERRAPRSTAYWMAWDQESGLWVFGGNGNGELGLKNVTYTSEFMLHPSLKPIEPIPSFDQTKHPKRPIPQEHK